MKIGHLRLLYIPVVFYLIGGFMVAWGVRSVAVSLSPVLPLIMAEDIPDYNIRVRSNDIFHLVSVDGLPRSTRPGERLVVTPESIPAEGELYGVIYSDPPGIIDAYLFYGDSPRELNMGVGTYTGHPGAYIPGSGRTVLLAGHANTVFSQLGELRAGDIIHIDTSYGRYRYRVTHRRIARDTDTSAYDFTRTDENLILYTCYPFDSFGLTNDRFFVYAEFLSGPKLDLVQTRLNGDEAEVLDLTRPEVEQSEASEDVLDLMQTRTEPNEAVVLDGDTLHFDIPVQIINGRTMVLYSDLAEAIGAEVFWDQSMQEISMYLDNNYIILRLNDNRMTFGQYFVDYFGYVIFDTMQELLLDSTPVIVDGRTFVPLRAASEALGAVVEWDPVTLTASIDTS